MFIKDICRNIAFYARNQISGMQHDWGRFRQCDKWKVGLLHNIVSGIIMAFLVVGASVGFLFVYHFARIYSRPLLILMNVAFAALAVYFTWYSIRHDVKIEEEKNIKEFCEG